MSRLIQDILTLILLVVPMIGSSAIIALVGMKTLEAIGNRPSDAPKAYLKMIILLFPTVFFAVVLLSVALLLFAKQTPKPATPLS